MGKPGGHKSAGFDISMHMRWRAWAVLAPAGAFG